jgi:hypothetical protein
VHFIRQILEALEHMHNLHIAHLDLKVRWWLLSLWVSLAVPISFTILLVMELGQWMTCFSLNTVGVFIVSLMFVLIFFFSWVSSQEFVLGVWSFSSL